MKKYLFAFLIVLSLFTRNIEAAPQIVECLKGKLNSDRIEYLFGNYGVEVLVVDSPVFPSCRISNLHSINDGKKIMRTLAVVDFFQPVDSRLIDAHHEIENGKSIGIVLREQGWNVHKAPVYFGVFTISPSVMKWMNEDHVDQAALHIYRLEVSKNNQTEKIPYCTILELHSPQYLTPDLMKQLNEGQYEKFSIFSQDILPLLNHFSLFIRDFPFPEGLNQSANCD